MVKDVVPRRTGSEVQKGKAASTGILTPSRD